MQRDGKNISGVSALGLILGRRFERCGRRRRQSLTRSPCAGKNRGSAVALMHVAIDGHCSANSAIALHAADSDGHVVYNAKAFPMTRECVMESSADAESDAVVKAMISRQNRAPGGEPEGAHYLRRVREFEFHLFASAECACLQLLDVLGRVHEQNILVGCGLRNDKISRRGNSGSEQPVMRAFIFFRGKNMGADGQEVVVAIDELEGQHSALSPLGL